MTLPARVLHVMNGAAGGAALSTISLMRSLAAEGVGSCAVCIDAGTRDEKERLRDACEGRVLFGDLYLWHRKLRADAWKRPLLEARQVWRTGAACLSSLKAARFASAHGVELVHSNTSLTLEGTAVARRLRVGHVWHIREIIGADAPFRFGIEGAAFGRYLSRHASIVVANSTATAERLEGIPAQQLAVVENGIDIQRFDPRPRVRSGRTVVGMVGSLTSRWKKHALFIEACAALSRDLDVQMRIYGHGADSDPYVAELHALAARLGVGDRLHFAGFVDDPAAVMAELDVLVHPADGESFGRIVVEAWAAGLPVVGVNGGGVGALVTHEHDGLLVAPDDATALAAATERVVRDRLLRARLGKNGRATAERRFSLAAYARRMAEVYCAARAAPLARAS